MEAEKRSEASGARKEAVELKKAAVENLTKYLEMKPDAADKETIQALIEESNTFISGDDAAPAGHE